jgi:antitoxin component YwqK of YwqJK toxin-antitoxin module
MLTEITTRIHHYFVDDANRKQGAYKEFYSNGMLYMHVFYLNGRREGLLEMFFSDGQLKFSVMCVDDNFEGLYTSYHDNGALNHHFYYKKGLRHGEIKTFSSTGDIVYSSFCYKNRDLHVDPDTLTEQDKVYIMMCGRLPPKEPSC